MVDLPPLTGPMSANALAHVQPAGGGVEILFDQPLQGLVQPEDVLREKAVPFAAAGFLHAVGHDHVVHPGVGVGRDARVGLDQLVILGERALPGQVLFLAPVLAQPLQQIHGVPSRGKHDGRDAVARERSKGGTSGATTGPQGERGAGASFSTLY